METISRIKRAKVITTLDDYRQESLKLFEAFVTTQAVKDLFGAQGDGELKLLIDKVKTDLLAFESKLEELL
jgi:hypothetical protein